MVVTVFTVAVQNFTVPAGAGLGSASITDLGLLLLEEGLCLVWYSWMELH